jgi:hypothetical protein
MTMAAVISRDLSHTLGDTLAQSLARNCATLLAESQSRRFGQFIDCLKASPGRDSRNAAYQHSIRYARTFFGRCVVDIEETGTGKSRVTEVTGMHPLEEGSGRMVFRCVQVTARHPGDIRHRVIGSVISTHAIQRLIQDLHTDDPATMAKILYGHACNAANEVPDGWPINREWLTVDERGVGVWVRMETPDGVTPSKDHRGSPSWMLMATWIPAASATYGLYGRAMQRYREGLDVNTLKC